MTKNPSRARKLLGKFDDADLDRIRVATPTLEMVYAASQGGGYRIGSASLQDLRKWIRLPGRSDRGLAAFLTRYVRDVHRMLAVRTSGFADDTAWPRTRDGAPTMAIFDEAMIADFLCEVTERLGSAVARLSLEALAESGAAAVPNRDAVDRIRDVTAKAVQGDACTPWWDILAIDKRTDAWAPIDGTDILDGDADDPGHASGGSACAEQDAPCAAKSDTGTRWNEFGAAEPDRGAAQGPTSLEPTDAAAPPAPSQVAQQAEAIPTATPSPLLEAPSTTSRDIGFSKTQAAGDLATLLDRLTTMQPDVTIALEQALARVTAGNLAGGSAGDGLREWDALLTEAHQQAIGVAGPHVEPAVASIRQAWEAWQESTEAAQREREQRIAELQEELVRLRSLRGSAFLDPVALAAAEEMIIRELANLGVVADHAEPAGQPAANGTSQAGEPAEKPDTCGERGLDLTVGADDKDPLAVPVPPAGDAAPNDVETVDMVAAIPFAPIEIDEAVPDQSPADVPDTPAAPIDGPSDATASLEAAPVAHEADLPADRVAALPPEPGPLPSARAQGSTASHGNVSTGHAATADDRGAHAAGGGPGPTAAQWEAMGSLVQAGRVAAAYWVSEVTGADVALRSALRLAAGAFASMSVLPEADGDAEDGVLAGNHDAAVLMLVAEARAALSAGWGSKALLGSQISNLGLDDPWIALLSGVVDAVRDGHVHTVEHVTRSEARTRGRADIGADARAMLAEIPTMTVVYQPATAVLHYLGRKGEPLHQVLTAVSRWAAGDDGALPTITEATKAIKGRKRVTRLIHDTDTMLYGRVRKNKIENLALQQLIARIDDVSALGGEALRAAREGGPADGRERHDDRHGATLVSLAEAAPSSPASSLADAGLLLLRSWILNPAPQAQETGEDIDALLRAAALPLAFAPRDADGMPVLDDVDRDRAVAFLLDPPTADVLFDEFIERGDVTDARLVVDAFGDKELEDRLPDAASGAKRKALAEVKGARGRFDRVRMQVPLDATVDATLSGQAESLWPPMDKDRLDLVRAAAQALTAELDGLAAEEAARAHARLQVVDGLTDEQSRRVADRIAAHDLTTAGEFLSFLEAGQDLPPDSDPSLSLLPEFLKDVQRLTSDDVARTAQAVVDALGKDVAGQRAEDGLPAFDALLSKQQRWWDTTEINALIRSTLRLFGLDPQASPVPVKGPARSGRRTYSVKAIPADGSHVPPLGSKASNYGVVFLAEAVPAGRILDAVPDGSPHGANLIMYPGRLSPDDRATLLRRSRTTLRTALVVDTVAAGWLAANHPGSFRALQEITLPYSAYEHYSPYVAGEVADEVFVGRETEMRAVLSSEGGIFVYGGRQLGKSALLRRAGREFGKTPGHVTVYIDLKAHGIGEFNPAEDLWRVLRDELRAHGVIDEKTGSGANPGPALVLGLIRKWLDADDTRRMLLLLDEADLFLASEARKRMVGGQEARFPNVSPLKGLMDTMGRRFKPVFAGLHQVQRFRDISNTPLAHGGPDILVGPLDQRSAASLVQRPLAVLGYRFESQDLPWRLLAFTNYQAGLIQIVCASLIRHVQRNAPRPGEPPITVTSDDVDRVITDREVLSQIAERFRLTMNLEDRYRVITLVLALLSMEDNFTARYSPGLLLDWCRDAWPDGFNSLSQKDFKVYLHEMQGLGVLVVHATDEVSLRSPNITAMIGSRSDIETELTEGRDRFSLPHDYNPRATRRQVPGLTGTGGPQRSPLTEEDLALLLPMTPQSPREPIVVVGSEATGIDRVAAVLREVAKERDIPVHVVAADDVEQAVQAGARSRQKRPTLIVDAVDADPAAVDAVMPLLVKQADSGIQRSIVTLGPSSLDALDAVDTEPLTLRTWTDEALRAWADIMFDTPVARAGLLDATGGWPCLLERTVDDALKSGKSAARAIEAVQLEMDNPVKAQDFLAKCGLADGPARRLAANWAQLTEPGEVLPIPDVAALDESLTDAAVTGLVRRLALLQAVTDEETGYRLSPVVHRALRIVTA